MGIAYNTSIVRDGLVLHLDAANVKSYPGSGTTWYDLSGNGYNAELINGAYAENGSVILDGVNDYIDFGQLLVLTSSGTPNSVEFWFETNKSTTDVTVSGIQNFTGHSTITDDIQYLSIRNKLISIWNKTAGALPTGWYSGNTEILLSKSYHMTLTFDGNGVYKLYIDSLLDSNWGNFGTVDTRCAFSRIGNLSSDRDFSGKIHSFKVYNKNLSESEIKQNFEAFRGRYGI